MQGDVKKITEQYESKMQAIFDAHEKQMEQAQRAFEEAVKRASAQLSSIIEADSTQAPKKQKSPEALWIKTSDGELILTLNQEAAVMQIALLDQLSTVLDELAKLAPRKA